MAGNQVTLTFAGDANKLVKEQQRAAKATQEFADGATQASRQAGEAASASSGLTDRLSKLGNIAEGATAAIDSAGSGMQALVDIQQAGTERAARLARAVNDVKQAQEDAAQATRDYAQAGIDSRQAAQDVEQAELDKKVALEDYTAAVKEHGKNSNKAQQAWLDAKQAGIDLAQANEDSAQATRDASQATIDAEAAQLDLNEAQREANPPEMQGWADKLNLVTPLISALVGVVTLATAAQWSLNVAWLASPITWIVVGIAAVVAAIVLIATKTDWFQKAWRASWGWVKSAASNTWEFLQKIPGWIGTAFSKVSSAITAPFRSAFNFVADAWNNTVGALHFSIPGWVPGLGGNSFGVPNIPKFHTGGMASGAMGGEFLAVLRAGERVTPPTGSAGRGALTLAASGNGTSVDRALAEMVVGAINRGALKLTVRNDRVAAANG
ncbi:hypothetical protein [Asanoa siamensis]|uniref:Phage tail tape measure protein n=1 Tax=Asanoa siamensis TaxID=926357 RepID=A0ABQ4CKU0_9ACTN|nr:hypothetical protein [Asanoa siamensis]GIF71912.1 hypothetical protein Asi02nite_14300 [Asanoa siamensis]